MPKQSLKDRDIAIAIAELSGKLSIREIRDHLKARGLIEVPADVIDRYELELARKAIQRARKYENPQGDGPAELVSLFERDPASGAEVRYYKPLRQCSVDEGVKLCTHWHNKGRQADKRLLRYVGVLTEIHGRKFQRKLPFDIPPEEPGPDAQAN